MGGDIDSTDRRGLLQAIAAAGSFGLAGCLGGGGGEGGTSTPTPTRTRTNDGRDGTPTPSARVSARQSGREVLVTLEDRNAVTDRVELRGCATDETLDSTDGDELVTGCERNETIRVVAVSENGRERVIRRIPVEPLRGVQVEIRQRGEAVTVVANGLAYDVFELELGGCGSGSIREGEAASTSGCEPGDTVTVAASYRERATERILTYSYEASSDGTAPSIDVTVNRYYPRTTVTVRSAGESVDHVDVGGCIDRDVAAPEGVAVTEGCELGDVLRLRTVTGD